MEIDSDARDLMHVNVALVGDWVSSMTCGAAAGLGHLSDILWVWRAMILTANQ